MRLSEDQRTVLELIATCEASVTERTPIGMPLYIEHIPSEIQYRWQYDRERMRWLENLKTRGLITIKDNCFLRLTDLGREALK